MPNVKHALDAGAQGIVVPMVHGPEDVQKAVRFARFPPLGERGAGALTAHLGLGVSRPEYLARANAEILVGVQIETREAVERVGEILDVPGLGLCFIGPNDLHMALGLAPRFWSDEPPFARAVARVRGAAAQRGIPLGTLCRDAASARTRLEEGFAFVGIGSDAHYLLTFAGMELGRVRGIAEPGSWCDLVRFD
jgi:4-hydroxy-2-oxoheptanedioate aldolase